MGDDDARFEATLRMLAPITAGFTRPWWLIGSAAVRLHGADAGPIGDLDLLLAEPDAERLFAMLGLRPVSGAAHAHFRSRRFGRWTKPPLPVEFMAGFEHRTAQGWAPVEPATRLRLDHPAGVFFVPSCGELSDILRRFGRPKDLMRAAALEALPRSP